MARTSTNETEAERLLKKNRDELLDALYAFTDTNTHIDEDLIDRDLNILIAAKHHIDIEDVIPWRSSCQYAAERLEAMNKESTILYTRIYNLGGQAPPSPSLFSPLNPDRTPILGGMIAMYDPTVWFDKKWNATQLRDTLVILLRGRAMKVEMVRQLNTSLLTTLREKGLATQHEFVNRTTAALARADEGEAREMLREIERAVTGAAEDDEVNLNPPVTPIPETEGTRSSEFASEEWREEGGSGSLQLPVMLKKEKRWKVDEAAAKIEGPEEELEA